jgi:aldehyde:ferredoxin oxidoreductase
MGGCHACPIRCHVYLDVPSVERFGVSRYAANTCVGWWVRGAIPSYPGGSRGMAALEGAVVGSNMSDDYGVWCNYGLLPREFNYAVRKGIVKEKLSKAEYDSIPWAKYENGDPSFLIDFVRRIAMKEGELGTALGEGSGRLAARWGFGQDYYDDYSIAWWKMGHPKHHSNEDAGQIGVLSQMMYNRDAQIHSYVNFTRDGLPIAVQKSIAAKVFGSPDAVDEINNYTRMNQYKAKFTKWSLLRKELHDSLTICNWMGPWIDSPRKERGYYGDDDLEAGLYSLATGEKKSKEELDVVAERIFNLHRALTIRDMGTKEMRAEHDTVPNWVFDYPKDAVPFTPGNLKMERGDIELGKNMLYMELGWDGATGTPTRYTYERLGMKDVADGLAKMGLL